MTKIAKPAINQEKKSPRKRKRTLVQKLVRHKPPTRKGNTGSRTILDVLLVSTYPDEENNKVT